MYERTLYLYAPLTDIDWAGGTMQHLMNERMTLAIARERKGEERKGQSSVIRSYIIVYCTTPLSLSRRYIRLEKAISKDLKLCGGKS